MTDDQNQPRGAVVVGVEGSDADDQQLRAAIAHARRHHRPLHVLHATAGGILPWTPERLGRQRALTARCLDRVRSRAPDLESSSATVVGDQAAALVAASRTGSLVVLGAGRRGRVGSVLLGATTGKVASHAHCPVMVVPDAWSEAADDEDEPLEVLVAVDDDEHSLPALEWAFAEASARSAPLLAVHAWWWEEPGPLSSGIVDDDEEWEDAAQAQRVMMSEMLAGLREKFPDVEAGTEFIRAETTAALEEASGDAQLLVLGTRGRGGFAGLLLGSVSARALHHTRCPVVVVPSTSRAVG